MEIWGRGLFGLIGEARLRRSGGVAMFVGLQVSAPGVMIEGNDVGRRLGRGFGDTVCRTGDPAGVEDTFRGDGKKKESKKNRWHRQN